MSGDFSLSMQYVSWPRPMESRKRQTPSNRRWDQLIVTFLLGKDSNIFLPKGCNKRTPCDSHFQSLASTQALCSGLCLTALEKNHETKSRTESLGSRLSNHGLTIHFNALTFISSALTLLSLRITAV